jgi:hypothetical protein
LRYGEAEPRPPWRSHYEDVSIVQRDRISHACVEIGTEVRERPTAAVKANSARSETVASLVVANHLVHGCPQLS